MKRILLFFALAISSAGFCHKFYVAVVNMEWNEPEQRIDVFVKATAHDFQAIIENEMNLRIDLDTIPNNEALTKWTSDYLQKNFKLSSLNVEAKFNYIGMEVTERLNTFFYFTFTEVLNPRKIKIVSTFLFNRFPKQQNIVHYKHGDQTKSVTLVASSAEGEIKFE